MIKPIGIFIFACGARHRLDAAFQKCVVCSTGQISIIRHHKRQQFTGGRSSRVQFKTDCAMQPDVKICCRTVICAIRMLEAHVFCMLRQNTENSWRKIEWNYIPHLCDFFIGRVFLSQLKNFWHTELPFLPLLRSHSTTPPQSMLPPPPPPSCQTGLRLWCPRDRRDVGNRTSPQAKCTYSGDLSQK
jgi:hypothetical protein